PGPVALPGEEGRGFFQEVALHPQDAVLGSQVAQFVPLGGGQAVAATACIEVRLAQPVADDLPRAAQIAGELLGIAPALADQADGFSAEFRGVGGMALGHLDSLLGTIIPKRSSVHLTGGTPPVGAGAQWAVRAAPPLPGRGAAGAYRRAGRADRA